MNKPGHSITILHSALCIAAVAVQTANAATVYLTANDTHENSSFTNPAPWSVYGVPSPENDYVVNDGHQMCPPRWYSAESPSVFNGHSLTIGEVGGTGGSLVCFPFAAGATVTFDNEGIVFANGTFCDHPAPSRSSRHIRTSRARRSADRRSSPRRNGWSPLRRLR